MSHAVAIVLFMTYTCCRTSEVAAEEGTKAHLLQRCFVRVPDQVRIVQSLRLKVGIAQSAMRLAWDAKSQGTTERGRLGRAVHHGQDGLRRGLTRRTGSDRGPRGTGGDRAPPTNLASLIAELPTVEKSCASRRRYPLWLRYVTLR